jgi:hypothetical protein
MLGETVTLLSVCDEAAGTKCRPMGQGRGDDHPDHLVDRSFDDATPPAADINGHGSVVGRFDHPMRQLPPVQGALRPFGGGGTARAWAKPRAAAVRFIPAAGSPRRAIAIALRGRTNGVLIEPIHAGRDHAAPWQPIGFATGGGKPARVPRPRPAVSSNKPPRPRVHGPTAIACAPGRHHSRSGSRRRRSRGGRER